VIERHHHQDFAAQLFLIELECLRAIPIVVQVRVHLHFSRSPLPSSASHKSFYRILSFHLLFASKQCLHAVVVEFLPGQNRSAINPKLG
jgi:hypothetical protein